MVFNLRSYLCGDRFCPWLQRQVEVRAENPRERFWGDERLVQVPHEAIAYPVRLRLELDAYGDECRRFFCLCVYCCLWAVADNQVRGSARSVQHTTRVKTRTHK